MYCVLLIVLGNTMCIECLRTAFKNETKISFSSWAVCYVSRVSDDQLARRWSKLELNRIHSPHLPLCSIFACFYISFLFASSVVSTLCKFVLGFKLYIDIISKLWALSRVFSQRWLRCAKTQTFWDNNLYLEISKIMSI